MEEVYLSRPAIRSKLNVSGRPFRLDLIPADVLPLDDLRLDLPMPRLASAFSVSAFSFFS
jgi:hypothetical protein